MNLISKKDLLALTGISYGQLYRWKRQRLIPDEWFIKQSSYTGQETFFPREQILSRVQSILDLKDEYSLEELARVLSPETAETSLAGAQVKSRGEIDPELVDALSELRGKDDYGFWEIVLIIGISQALKKGELSGERLAKLIGRSLKALEGNVNPDLLCTVFVAGKKHRTVLSQGPVQLDGSMEIVAEIPLGETASRLKVSYKNLFAEK